MAIFFFSQCDCNNRVFIFKRIHTKQYSIINQYIGRYFNYITIQNTGKFI